MYFDVYSPVSVQRDIPLQFNFTPISWIKVLGLVWTNILLTQSQIKNYGVLDGVFNQNSFT
jgi:hypothetical protein